jgi:hypothetical protein
MEARRVLVWRVLRERRRLIAEADMPVLRVSYAAIAAIVGHDRGTIAAWAAEAPGLRTERGCVVIYGIAAMEAARESGCTVATMDDAIAWLARRLQAPEPVTLPPEPTVSSDLRWHTYPTLGTSSDPTVDELAALIYDGSPRDGLTIRIERGRHLRGILAEHGLAVPEGGRIPGAWLTSPEGRRAWLHAASRPPKRKKSRRKHGDR